MSQQSEEYIKDATRTESTNFDEIAARLQSKRSLRLLHGSLGLTTEAAEFADAIKKHVYYGKELDTVNLFEEVGDLFWYLAIVADELGFDFEQAMETNIKKLKSRYGERFSQDRALKRQLSEERGILESDAH